MLVKHLELVRQARYLFGRLDLGCARQEHQSVLLGEHTAVSRIQMCLVSNRVQDSAQHCPVEAPACLAIGLANQGGKHVLNISTIIGHV